MTLENPNWKNVGNWHWREKNCINWVKEYLQSNLVGLDASKNDVAVKVTSIDSCEGDAALHVRKGKLITIFDLSMALKWSGSCDPDITATGTIQIPEVAHDTEENDYTFNISIDNESRLKDKIKEVVRKDLVPKLKASLKTLGPELVKANSTDIYIENATKSVDIRLASVEDRRIDSNQAELVESFGTPAPSGTSSSSTAVPPSKPSAASSTTMKSSNASPTTTGPTKPKPNTPQSISVCEIKKTVEFVAPPSDVFASFTDPQRVQLWSQGGRSDGKEGGQFSLFGNSVSGMFEKVDQNAHLIIMKWRSNDWPSGHFSTVNITFSPTSSSTMCNVRHSKIPTSYKEKAQSIWDDWYFRRMKGVFGWGGF